MFIQTHLGHVSSRTQHSRHQHNVGEREPSCSLRPAEVLVAVGGHVYSSSVPYIACSLLCLLYRLPCAVGYDLPTIAPLSAVSWRAVCGGVGGERTGPFDNGGIRVDHCVLLAIAPQCFVEWRYVLPWLWPAILRKVGCMFADFCACGRVAQLVIVRLTRCAQ
jgi:hypothetical protein